jgi:hypothetical protein
MRNMGIPTDSVIEVVADIWCPFVHVGLRAVDELPELATREGHAFRAEGPA